MSLHSEQLSLSSTRGGLPLLKSRNDWSTWKMRARAVLRAQGLIDALDFPVFGDTSAVEVKLERKEKPTKETFNLKCVLDGENSECLATRARVFWSSPSSVDNHQARTEAVFDSAKQHGW